MQFFSSAIDTLQDPCLVFASSAGSLGGMGRCLISPGRRLCASDNPRPAKSPGPRSREDAPRLGGGGIILLVTTLIPLLSGLF